MNLLESAQAARRGSKGKKNSVDLAAPRESVVREFLESLRQRDEESIAPRGTLPGALGLDGETLCPALSLEVWQPHDRGKPVRKHEGRETMANKKDVDKPYDDNRHTHEPHGQKPHDPPYYDPDYERPPHHGHEPPDNPRYPDSRIYGNYASKNPPRYVPHPFEHTCFKPRKEDYKPPATCDGHNDKLCVRKDHRTLTADEQSRFLNAFTQINTMGARGPLV
ncbi:MAG: hypothetical protein ACRD7E_19730, partial [Bryobacteraceae bacterium]